MQVLRVGKWAWLYPMVDSKTVALGRAQKGLFLFEVLWWSLTLADVCVLPPHPACPSVVLVSGGCSGRTPPSLPCPIWWAYFRSVPSCPVRRRRWSAVCVFFALSLFPPLLS